MNDEMSETWVLFASEGREALEAAERCVLELEDGFDQERVNELYRAVHTLKGNARVMGLSSMEALAHHAEDVVGLVRDHDHPMDQTVTDLVFQSLDHLGRLLTAAEEARADVPCDESKATEDALASYFGRHKPKISLTPSQRALPSEHPGDLFFFSQLPGPQARISIAPVKIYDLPPEDAAATLDVNISVRPTTPPADEGDAEMVKIFLEVAVEHLDGLRASFDQLEDPDTATDARERATMAIDALHHASSQMGYQRVTEQIEELRGYIAGGADDVTLLKEVLARLMEEVACVQSTDDARAPEQHEAVGMMRAFHSMRMLEQLEVMQAEVGVMQRQLGLEARDNNTLRQSGRSVSVALASLYHAFEHHQIHDAATLALQLSDVAGRIGAAELEASPAVVEFFAQAVAIFEDMAHGDSYGGSPAELARLKADADDILTPTLDCSADEDRRLLASVPETMRRFFTEGHLESLRAAFAERHCVCEIKAALEEDEELAARVLEFVATHCSVIASAVSPGPTGNVTELLVCSRMEEAELFARLAALDPKQVVEAHPLVLVSSPPPEKPSQAARPQGETPRPSERAAPPPPEPTMQPAAPPVVSEPEPPMATPVAEVEPPPAKPVTAPASKKTKPEKKVEKEDQLIRLSASKVDALMSLAGEINLALGSVLYHPDLEGLDLTGFSAAAHRVEMLIRELQDSTAGLGLTPVAGVFNRTRRLVRDLARQTGKQIKLVIRDNETEIDRMLVDRIYEPLIHIIRNAADHGLESAEDRVAAGKPAEGTIKLVAAQEGGSILIRIEDDGRGLNIEKIIEIARSRGVIGPDEEVSDERARQLIFEPGFSTADEISNLSGRGVGMDVVNTTLEELNGRIVVDSTVGRGTRVDLYLPLTLAFAEVIVVEVDRRLFAIPMSAVSSIFRPDSGQVTDVSADGETVVRVLDELIPVTWLERFYHASKPANDTSRAAAGRIIVAVQTRRGKRAIPIERIVGAERVTMKSLPEPMREIRAAAGCGVLRSGEVAIALDCERLFDERAA